MMQGLMMGLRGVSFAPETGAGGAAAPAPAPVAAPARVAAAPATPAPAAAPPAPARGRAAPAVAEPAAAAGGGDGDGDEGAGAPPWRDDWREALAGGDDKALARLKRFANPDALFKSYRNLETRVSSGQLKSATLPEGASDEEIADFRKQHGIPEAPDGYGLKFPDGVKPTEADTAQLASFAAKMHSRHVPPGQVQAAFAAFNELVTEAQTARAEAQRELTVQSQAQLRAEYGADYKRYFGDARSGGGLVNDFLAETIAAANPKGTGDLPENMMNWQLADGRTLGNMPEFARWATHLALQLSDEDRIHAGGDAGGGKSLDDDYADMIKQSVANPKLEKDKAFQAKLQKLAEARVARDERQGRGRAGA